MFHVAFILCYFTRFSTGRQLVFAVCGQAFQLCHQSDCLFTILPLYGIQYVYIFISLFFSKLMLHEKQTNRLGLISNHLPDFDTMSRGLFVLSVPFELQFQFSLLVVALYFCLCLWRWLGSRVVSVLDSVAEWPGFKSQSRRCRVTVLDKLFTPIVPLFSKQQSW